VGDRHHPVVGRSAPTGCGLSFDRFDPASNRVELIADVDNCKLFDD
jgi:hypothetical protein